MNRNFLLVVLAVCAALSLTYAWRQGRPVVLVDALSDHLSCVSYAPFRQPGQTPFDKSVAISAQQIDSDLALLSKRFDCVRTYAVAQGLDQVPAIAQKYGMKVLLGIWIGRKDSDNRIEIAKAVAVARAHAAAIRGVIVGNEVLLRSEQPADAMIGYAHMVKQQLPDIPISYADVWEFWLKNRQLADAVDVLTIHILPYWEDKPVAIENAVGHVSYIFHMVQDQFPGRIVQIGETGWPSYGRQRQAAVPSLVNQARFIREFAVRAELEHIPYNVIEAFDQPWKRKLEGAVGGYWGLYDAQDRAKFPFKGAVAENPHWRALLAVALGAALVFGVAGWRAGLRGSAGMAPVLGGFCTGMALAVQWHDMALANRNWVEWTATDLYLGALGLCGLLLSLSVLHPRARHPAPAAALARWLRRNERHYGPQERWLGFLRLAFLFGMAFVCLLLAFDSRYRDFPLALYAVPSVGYALLALRTRRADADLEELMLAGWIAIAAPFIALNEHLVTPRNEPWSLATGVNGHALAWAALCWLMAGSVLVPVIRQLRAGQRQHAQ